MVRRLTMSYNARTGQWEEGSASGGVFPFLSQEKNKYVYDQQFPGEKERQAQAAIAASKGQGSGEGLSGINAHFGGEGTFIDQLKKMLQSGKYNEMLGIGKPPQPAGFGFDLPTMEMGGNVLGGIGKFMTGLGSLETAKYAGKSFDEKSKYNALNWQAQLAKRAGEVSGENALRRDDNAYRTAQGIGHLADYITA